LFDIATGIVEAFSDSYGDKDLGSADEIAKGRIPIEIDDAREICKINISVKRTDSEQASEAYFLIFCDKLHTITGQKQGQGENISTQNISKAMLNHVQAVPIPVTVKLADTKFNFHELMSLQVDDIILLDKKVNESAELIIEGRPRLRGQLAKSDSKYAVVITELCNNK
jgi:flagellar motor switch/type III secretory pathway protein FliN